MNRIAIVGGGITGLAAAYELERTSDVEIDLYEASSRLGGKLRTEAEGGLLVEGGPDCFFSRKPGVLELVRELGIEGEIVAPKAGEFGMVVDGALHLVPRGLVALNAPSASAITAATFLSDEGKARALSPKRVESGRDLSVRDFFAGRYGAEFSRLVAEPLLAGTHGGDPARLSMGALYPAYLVQESTATDPGGSFDLNVTTPALPSPKEEAMNRPTFLSFRGGMQTLVDALARSLRRTRVQLDASLERLPPADRTLLAIPANRAVALLPGAGLEAIGHRSSVIVTLAFRREDVRHSLDGTGFLVPPTEEFPVTGATWSSEKWPGRSPEGTALMRVFLREEAEFLPALRELLGIRGEPIFSRVDRWADALPQYEVGHLDLVDAIEARLPEGVFVAGTSYRGVGIPDGLRQGRGAGRRILETL